MVDYSEVRLVQYYGPDVARRPHVNAAGEVVPQK
jgi:hypothetical protein